MSFHDQQAQRGGMDITGLKTARAQVHAPKEPNAVPQYEHAAKEHREALSMAEDALRHHENAAANQRVFIAMMSASLEAYDHAVNQPEQSAEPY